MGDIGLNNNRKNKLSLIFFVIYCRYFLWSGCEKNDILSMFKRDLCKLY